MCPFNLGQKFVSRSADMALSIIHGIVYFPTDAIIQLGDDSTHQLHHLIHRDQDLIKRFQHRHITGNNSSQLIRGNYQEEGAMNLAKNLGVCYSNVTAEQRWVKLRRSHKRIGIGNSCVGLAELKWSQLNSKVRGRETQSLSSRKLKV